MNVRFQSDRTPVTLQASHAPKCTGMHQLPRSSQLGDPIETDATQKTRNEPTRFYKTAPKDTPFEPQPPITIMPPVSHNPRELRG